MSDMTDVPQEDEESKRRGLALWTLSGTTALVLLVGGVVAFTGSQKTESGNPQAQQSIKPTNGTSSGSNRPGSIQPSSPGAPNQPGPVTEPTQDPGAAGDDSGVTAGDKSQTEQPGNAPGATPTATNGNGDTTSITEPGRNPGDPTEGTVDVPGQPGPTDAGQPSLQAPTVEPPAQDPEPTSTDVPAPKPTSTDVSTPQPTSTDVPAPQPTSTDVSTPQPTPTNVPTTTPTLTPPTPTTSQSPKPLPPGKTPRFLQPSIEWFHAVGLDGQPLYDFYGNPIHDMRLSFKVPDVPGEYFVTVKDDGVQRTVRIVVDGDKQARLDDEFFINYPLRQLPQPDPSGRVSMDLSPNDFGLRDTEWGTPEIEFSGESSGDEDHAPVPVVADPPPVIPPMPTGTPTPTPTEGTPGHGQQRGEDPATDDPVTTASPSPTPTPSASASASASSTASSTTSASSSASATPTTASTSRPPATVNATTTAKPTVTTQKATPVVTAGTTKAATTRAATPKASTTTKATTKPKASTAPTITPKPKATPKKATTTTSTSDDQTPASPSTTQQRPLAVQGPRRATLSRKRVQTRP